VIVVRCPHCGATREPRDDGRLPKHSVSRYEPGARRTLREPCPGSEMDVVAARVQAAEDSARRDRDAAATRDLGRDEYARTRREIAAARIAAYDAETQRLRERAAAHEAVATALRGAT
jgi:hypothetical protein